MFSLLNRNKEHEPVSENEEYTDSDTTTFHILPREIVHSSIRVDGVLHTTAGAKTLCWLPGGKEIIKTDKGLILLCQVLEPDGYVDARGNLHSQKQIEIIKVVENMEEEIMNIGGRTLF